MITHVCSICLEKMKGRDEFEAENKFNQHRCPKADKRTKAGRAQEARRLEAKRNFQAQLDNDRKAHPISGKQAPEGQHWVTNLLSQKVVLEPDGTPWTLSVASETYHSS